MRQQSNAIQQKLEAYFKSQDESEEKIFYQLMLYIFGLESKQHDLYLLAKVRPTDHLITFINYFAHSHGKRHNALISIAYLFLPHFF